MNREESWPLVVFPALSPIAIGGLAGLLAVRGSPKTGLDVGARTLLAVALLASALHLGRPLRAYPAMVRLSTSWLSREVVLFGIFLVPPTAYALPLPIAGWDAHRGTIRIPAALVGGFSLLAGPLRRESLAASRMANGPGVRPGRHRRDCRPSSVLARSGPGFDGEEGGNPPLQGRAGGGDARVALPGRQARSRGSGVPVSRAASAAQTDRTASRGRDYCLLAWLLLEAPAVQPGRNE